MQKTPQERIREFILEARTRKGWSQRALARHIGTYHSQVNNWENGINIPSADFIFKVADAVGAEIKFIWPENEEPETSEKP